MHPGGPAWAAALEGGPLAEAIRSASWAYPICNVLHVLGVGLLLGAVLLADLRVLGAGAALPLGPFLRLCNWPIRIGIALALPTGILLFVADAAAQWANPAFRVKLALVAAGLANGLLFVLAWRRPPLAPSATMRAQALCSLLLWPVAAAVGRLVAYF